VKLYYERDIDRHNLPRTYRPEQELIRAIVRQAALDLKRGPQTKNRNEKIVEEHLYHYQTAKAWLQHNLDLLIYATGVSHAQAETFVERH
jgi:hypothetical protein